MSIAGGLEKALERGEESGCQTIQIFTKNNNQWRAKPLMDDEIAHFQSMREKTKIAPVFAHASYLINIASPDPALHQMSARALHEELERCEKLKLSFLVLHPGARKESDEKVSLKKIAGTIHAVFEKTRGYNVILLLENMAGQGTSLGHRFEQLATIIDLIGEKERIGVCFDTCHGFQGGYDIRTEDGCERTFEQFDRLIGIEKLKAFHLNDSKREFQAHVDRHEHIGKGYIGKNAFRYLMNDPRFENIPMVLETPKGKTCREDRENLRILRSLII